MDDITKSLLDNWGFCDLVDVFKENLVDIDALSLLDDSQISILIRPIGTQAKFKKALSDWKKSQKKIIGVESDDEELNCSTYGDSMKTSPPASPCMSSKSSISSVSSYTQSDLTLLLKSTPEGEILLKQDQEKPLSEQYRKILVRAISREILKHDPKAQITAATFSSWLQEIKRLFPKENLGLYYTRAKGGLQRAHGRLYEGVSNLKAKYRKHGVYEPRARRLDYTPSASTPSASTSSASTSSASISSAPASILETSDTPITQEEEESLEWLRCSTDDYALCEEKWQITNKQRKQRVLSNEKLSYLQEFPCLKRSWGHKLLTADFDNWYPQNEHSLDDKLPLLKTKLLSLYKGSKTPFVQELKQFSQDQNPETSNLAIFLLLPHMIGPVHLKRKRISAAEVRQSFISHIEEETKVLEERLKRQARYKSLGLTIQPYMIVAGPLKKIIAHYIVVDDIIYELPNISTTVDTCFKIIWALNLEYPSECLPVWQFIERAIYKFPENVTSKNRLSLSVQSLLSDCSVSF